MTDKPDFLKGGRGRQAPYVSTHVRVPEPLVPLVELLKSRYLLALDKGNSAQLLEQLSQAIAKAGQEKEKPVNELPDLAQVGHQLPEPDKFNKLVNDFKEGLTQEQLATRLRRDTANVGRHKKVGDLESWSQTLDPDNLAWRFDPKLKKYFPDKPVNE